VTTLLGPDGLPAANYAERKTGRPKNPKPLIGEISAGWQDAETSYLRLPGGGQLYFDTSQLTLGDFRRMSEHPQIASSLYALTFMLHQMEWELVGSSAKIRNHCDENLNQVWTRLIRSMGSAFTFGFSPNATQWENQTGNSRLWLNKIKDLVPEECTVNWKYVDGATIPGADGVKKPKVPIFDGIKQYGKHTVPVTNSFWYPLLMKNGDYRGTRILRAAFQPWYFSNLIKMFANQYYERFGSPLPVGRAPYDEDINIGTADQPNMQPGNKVMAQIIKALRNRSAVVLPNQRSQDGLNGTKTFDYELEYLESQMRGVEFERILQRYDEEMSLALFTPLLLMRTAEGGGYNQGIGHTQVFLWMLNAIAADGAEYIDRYILAPMTRYNFGANAEPPQIKFRKMGTAQQETLRAIVQALLNQNKIKVDVAELGAHIGLEIEEVKEITQPLDQPAVDDLTDPTNTNPPQKDKRTGRPERLKNDDKPNVSNPKAVTKQITARVSQQVVKAFATKSYTKDWAPSLGYHRQLVEALEANGSNDPEGDAGRFECNVLAVLGDVIATKEYFGDPNGLVRDFEQIVDVVLEDVM